MPKVFIYRNDTFRLHVQTVDEVHDVFGCENDDDNFNAELSNKLIERYQKAEKEFKAVQDEIYAQLKAKNNVV